MSNPSDDFLMMSDDDFLRNGESLLVEPEEEQNESDIPTEPETQEEDIPEQDGEPDSDTPEEQISDKPEEAEPVEVNTGLSAEEQLAKLFAPFKANGKDFQLNSIEEAISLAQMGANYAKKMAGLKPSMRILKMLENNGLLDENKLTYLIDLDKKNPGAINKLMKDSGVDPLEIDLDKSPEYTPGQYQVSELEMQVSDVLDNIHVTNPTHYPQLLQAITSMDNASKGEISKDPKILSLLSEQMANGVYDRIMTELDRQQTFGHLTDVPLLHAYYQVGDMLHKQGKLFPEIKPPKTDPIIEAAKSKADGNTDKKRSVAAPRSTGTSKKEEFNPLTMSDDEILRIANQRH